MKYLIRHIVLLCGLLLAGCMKWDYGDTVEDFNATGAGLFITNEGNFQYGNASLSYYDPETTDFWFIDVQRNVSCSLSSYLCAIYVCS